MIQVKLQIALATGEITSGAGYDFIQIKDLITNRFIGLWYDKPNDRFQLFDSTGSGIVNIPQPLTAGQFYGFTINMFPQTDGTQAVHIYHAGTYFGTFTTTLAMTPNALLLGAVALSHGSSGAVDRSFLAVKIGSAAGLTDIFTDGGYSGGTAVPPWTSLSGTTFAIAGLTLHLTNGGAVALVTKGITLPTGAPPPSALPPPPGVEHLVFAGDSSWQQSGAARWLFSAWDLDRLIIPYRGSIAGLDAFLNSFTPWTAWGGDPNMFLENYPLDEHKQFPTVNMTFLGKRNGVLPAPRNESTSSIQQASGIVFSDSYILTFGLPPHWTARITYISPINRFTVWSRTPPNFDAISAPIPPELTTSSIVSLVIGGIDYTVWPAVAGSYQGIVEWVLRWFFQRSARYTASQEIVSGQYFRAEVTTQVLLLPVQEEIVTT